MLGLIISDGHFHRDECNGGNGISISQKKSNDGFIRDCLVAAGADFTEHPKTSENVNGKKCNSTVFYIKAEYVKKFIYPYLTEKNISDKLMNLRDRQFRSLLSGLTYGDGSIIRRDMKYSKSKFCTDLVNEYPAESFIFFHTSVMSLKDRLCHLSILNGYGVNSKFRKNGIGGGGWCVNISNRRHVHFRTKKNKTKTLVSYKGKVWCVSVANGTLVARRNGFVFITGNCHGRYVHPGLAMDVGIDTNNYMPYSWDDIRKRMYAKVAENRLSNSYLAWKNTDQCTGIGVIDFRPESLVCVFQSGFDNMSAPWDTKIIEDEGGKHIVCKGKHYLKDFIHKAVR
jgi:hypothetical protein